MKRECKLKFSFLLLKQILKDSFNNKVSFSCLFVILKLFLVFFFYKSHKEYFSFLFYFSIFSYPHFIIRILLSAIHHPPPFGPHFTETICTSISPISFALHAARCTLHAARCTLHAARCTLHAARYTLHAYHFLILRSEHFKSRLESSVPKQGLSRPARRIFLFPDVLTRGPLL